VVDVTGDQLVNPAGYFRGLRLVLNGKSVTAAELADYWASAEPWCSCAPGLGYACPGHRSGAGPGPHYPGLSDPVPLPLGRGVLGA
jgi:hypothetical protein